MCDWLTAHYANLKDFAGPIATVFAASVAAGVALVFGVVQWRVAAAQRDIARDNLRFSLLQRRYAIYDAAKHLLEHAAFAREATDVDGNKIRNWYIQIEEAHFYFPDDTCAHLQTITKNVETYFQHVLEREHIDQEDTTRWVKAGEVLADNLKVLRDHYAELPKKFKRPLAFKQLIKE